MVQHKMCFVLFGTVWFYPDPLDGPHVSEDKDMYRFVAGGYQNKDTIFDWGKLPGARFTNMI